MKNFVCAIFMFVHFASGSLADAPKKTLYLQCGPHLVAIGTSLKQKMLNMNRAESECAYISHDTRTLWKDTKIGGPIEIKSSGAVACEDTFVLFNTVSKDSNAYIKFVDRITGELIWEKRYERVADCSNYHSLSLAEQINSPCYSSFLGEPMEYYFEPVGTYKCVAKTKSQLNYIISKHNNKIEKSKPERKF